MTKHSKVLVTTFMAMVMVFGSVVVYATPFDAPVDNRLVFCDIVGLWHIPGYDWNVEHLRGLDLEISYVDLEISMDGVARMPQGIIQRGTTFQHSFCISGWFQVSMEARWMSNSASNPNFIMFRLNNIVQGTNSNITNVVNPHIRVWTQWQSHDFWFFVGWQDAQMSNLRFTVLSPRLGSLAIWLPNQW